MGTLGYDPDRLGLLAAAIGDAAAALAQLHSTDPEAATALTVVGNARRMLDDWRARIGSIVACSALGGYRPVAIDATDLPHATEYVLTQLYGWHAATDPTGSRHWVPPAIRGAALGHLVATGTISVTDAAELAAFRTELRAVMIDPAGRAAFAANVTPAGVATLMPQLSRLRAAAVRDLGGPGRMRHDARVDAPESATVRAIDATTADLADALIDVDGPLETALSALAVMSPFQAALLVAHLDAPDDTIGHLATATLARLAERDDPANWLLPWEDAAGAQAGVGDVVFPRLAAGDAVSCHRVVTELLALDPDLLLATVGDTLPLAALVARATDPTAITAAQAGAVIVPYLAHLRRPATNPTVTSRALGEVRHAVPATLGALVAPWLPQFTVDTATWGWTDDDGADALAFAISDDAAFDELLAASDRWLDELPIDPDVGAGDDAADLFWELEAAGAMIGTVATLLRDRAARRAHDDRWLWDAFSEQFPKLLDKGLAKTGLTGVPARVASKAIGFGAAQGTRLAEEHGLPGAPAPLADVLRDLDVGVDEVFVVGAYLAMGSMLEVLIAAGRVPSTTPWPPEPTAVEGSPASAYLDATDEWLQGLSLDADTLFAFVSARSAFLSAAQSKRSYVDLLPA